MKSVSTKKFFACVISAAVLITLAACGSSQNADLDTLYKANTLASVLEQHNSIYEEFSYYENLDDEVTFKTSYCYSENSGDSVYAAEGYDAADEASEDNFSYCIINNLQYFMNFDGTMEVYPLASQYLTDFKENSISVYNSDYEVIDSAKTNATDIIITSLADMTDVYTPETLSSLESLCGDSLSSIKYVYSADKNTLLLNSVHTYFVAEDGAEYLFSEENVSYDTQEPSLDFADAYINAHSTRSITVVEKTDAGDIINTYTVPAGMAADFQCFEYYYGYTIYNDPDGNDPFVKETADGNGVFPNITYYALPSESDGADGPVNSTTPITSTEE